MKHGTQAAQKAAVPVDFDHLVREELQARAAYQAYYDLRTAQRGKAITCATELTRLRRRWQRAKKKLADCQVGGIRNGDDERE